jgi:Fic-DOC domain mobile mystery protein B
MGLNLEYIEGQTPIDEDEKEGLLIPAITTKDDLDEFEQLGVEGAIEWSRKRKIALQQILSEDFVFELHRRMFGEVWKWAGQTRTSNKNIGNDWTQIREELKKLLDDCKLWIDHKVFPEDEIAIRFSHRIVKIHLFPNGNGRHSRLIADIIVSHVFDRPVYSWGSINLTTHGAARSTYLKALKQADEGNYQPLIKFARQ